MAHPGLAYSRLFLLVLLYLFYFLKVFLFFFNFSSFFVLRLRVAFRNSPRHSLSKELFIR